MQTLEELENEFLNLTKNTNKPIISNWIPYKKFIKDIKNKKIVKKDKIIKELERDLEFE